MSYGKHPNENLRVYSGRFAGNGMEEEDYSEESFPGKTPWQDNKRCAEWMPPYKKIKKGKKKAEEPPIKKYKLSKEEINKIIGG